MDKTGLLEIKKRFKFPDISFSSMAYGMVSPDEGDVRLAFSGEGNFLVRDEDEQKAFASILSKAFSFSGAVSTSDIEVEGDMRKLLSDYSRKDDHTGFGLSELLTLITEKYDDPSSYCICIFRDNYDIPQKDSAKIKTGESEEVYQYFALIICPVKAAKMGLSPDMESLDIKRSAVLRQLQSPVFGLIYPSFTDRSADYDNAFVCCKTDKERDLVSSLFSKELEAPVKKEKAEVKKDIIKALDEFATETSDEEAGHSEQTMRIIEDIKSGKTEELKEELKKLDDFFSSKGNVNNVDAALLDKRAASDEEEEFTQEIEVKEDKSVVTIDRVTERDINGRKYFLVPKDLLPEDMLERILALG